ncbi:MAG: hypothetical protein SF339_12835 [Blastocatellia bacterium]|nr:hypothetical protein [Blastocatellia bacterium]
MSILVEEIMQRLDQLNIEELTELEQTLDARAKPGEENLRLLRVLDATRWQRIVQRTGRIARRTIVIGVLLAALAGTALALLFLWRTETLSAGTRQDQFQAAIAYRVEQHRYRDISLVTFDDGGDGQVVCHLSPMKIDKILEERWLANGRAIYLHLQLQSPEALGADGKPESRPARMIYDYHRGELYVVSPLHLWRTASSESRWMNEEEFNGLLARFNQ